MVPAVHGRARGSAKMPGPPMSLLHRAGRIAPHHAECRLCCRGTIRTRGFPGASPARLLADQSGKVTRKAFSPTAKPLPQRRHRFGDPRSWHTPAMNRVTMAMAGLLACASWPSRPCLPGFPVASQRASGSAPTVAGAATDLVPDGYAAPCSLLLPSKGNHHHSHRALLETQVSRGRCEGQGSACRLRARWHPGRL